MRIKTLILSLCLVVIVMSAAAGTIAYLTATDAVTNTFTVGNIGMKVDETKVTPDGVPVEGEERVQENNYHLIPGKTYVKDPTVTITAKSDPCYVRMIVKITEAAAIKAAAGDDFLPQDWVNGTWDPAIWVPQPMVEDTEADAFICEFRYCTTVDNSGSDADKELEALFGQIKVPETLGGDDLEALQDMKIIVQGHAIQTATFKNADDAWAAFDIQRNGN